MSRPKSWGDSHVTQKRPKLFDSSEADGCNCEQTDPFAAHDRTERKPGQSEPYPPAIREGLVFVFVTEATPHEHSQGGEEYQGGVQQDVTRLSDHAVLERDEQRREERCGGPTIKRTEGQIRKWHREYTEHSGDHAHSHVGDILIHSFESGNDTGYEEER